MQSYDRIVPQPPPLEKPVNTYYLIFALLPLFDLWLYAHNPRKAKQRVASSLILLALWFLGTLFFPPEAQASSINAGVESNREAYERMQSEGYRPKSCTWQGLWDYITPQGIESHAILTFAICFQAWFAFLIARCDDISKIKYLFYGIAIVIGVAILFNGSVLILTYLECFIMESFFK